MNPPAVFPTVTFDWPSLLNTLAPQRKDSPFLSQQSALLQSARLMGSSPKAGPKPTSRFLPTISDSSPTIGRGRSCDSSKASFSYVAPCVLKWGLTGGNARTPHQSARMSTLSHNWILRPNRMQPQGGVLLRRDLTKF